MPFIDDFYWYNLDDYGKVCFVDISDASSGYDVCLDLVLSQPRWVLDNMDYVKEFTVPWLSYDSSSRKGRFFASSAPYHHPNKRFYTKKPKGL